MFLNFVRPKEHYKDSFLGLDKIHFAIYTNYKVYHSVFERTVVGCGSARVVFICIGLVLCLHLNQKKYLKKLTKWTVNRPTRWVLLPW